MSLFRSARVVAGSTGTGAVDWQAAAEAAKTATDPGSLALEPGEKNGFARDVREAREAVQAVSGTTFAVPETIQVQNRHHWIDANVETFRRVMKPLEGRSSPVPAIARTINTGTMSVMLAFLGRHVLGQYDPLLLAESPTDQHALYFVRPNIRRVARILNVDFARFRRWIAFHEVTHAGEFGNAPWLSDYLEERLERGIHALADGSIDREAFGELDAAMTVVEGYAELLMDHAFDDEYADLRRKIDAQRAGRGPLQRLVRRLLGLNLKRRQYERGKTFFEHVTEVRGIETAGHVWTEPETLPTQEELDNPGRWLARTGM